MNLLNMLAQPCHYTTNTRFNSPPHPKKLGRRKEHAHGVAYSPPWSSSTLADCNPCLKGSMLQFWHSECRVIHVSNPDYLCSITCSMGLMSGHRTDQCMTSKSYCGRNAIKSLAVWDVALSGHRQICVRKRPSPSEAYYPGEA